MAWDFETDPEFQKKLDWIEDFMANEVEPISHLGMATGARKDVNASSSPCSRRLRIRSCGPATWVPSWAARAMAS